MLIVMGRILRQLSLVEEQCMGIGSQNNHRIIVNNAVSCLLSLTWYAHTMTIVMLRQLFCLWSCTLVAMNCDVFCCIESVDSLCDLK